MAETAYDRWKTDDGYKEACQDCDCIDGEVVGLNGEGAEVSTPCDHDCHLTAEEADARDGDRRYDEIKEGGV